MSIKAIFAIVLQNLSFFMAQRLTFIPFHLLSTAIALIRRGTIDDWAEQRLKHILLMLYLKDNNFTAATDVINKVSGLLCSKLGPEPTLPCFCICMPGDREK